MPLNQRVEHFVGIREHSVGEEEDGGEMWTWRVGQLGEEGGEGVHMGPWGRGVRGEG